MVPEDAALWGGFAPAVADDIEGAAGARRSGDLDTARILRRRRRRASTAPSRCGPPWRQSIRIVDSRRRGVRRGKAPFLAGANLARQRRFRPAANGTDRIVRRRHGLAQRSDRRTRARRSSDDTGRMPDAALSRGRVSVRAAAAVRSLMLTVRRCNEILTLRRDDANLDDVRIRDRRQGWRRERACAALEPPRLVRNLPGQAPGGLLARLPGAIRKTSNNPGGPAPDPRSETARARRGTDEAGDDMTKLKDLGDRFMEDPEFREEYARSDGEHALVEALVRARAAAKLTQEELARRLGTTRPVIAVPRHAAPLRRGNQHAIERGSGAGPEAEAPRATSGRHRVVGVRRAPPPGSGSPRRCAGSRPQVARCKRTGARPAGLRRLDGRGPAVDGAGPP